MRKRRIKKRRITSALIVFLLIVIICICLISIFSGEKIKVSYNQYAIVNKDTNIYDSKNKKIGKIYKNTYIELDKNNNKKYLKVKDSNYYIYYEDIKKSKKQENIIKDYFVPMAENITLNDKSKLYIKDKVSLELNKGYVYEVYYKDDNYYYIKLLGNTFGVKKEDIKEETPNKSVEKDAISILYYENNTDKIDEQFKYIKDNKYYSISIEDFTLWVNDKINLNNKTVLILSKDEEVMKKAKENGLYVENDYGNYNYRTYNATCKRGTKTDLSVYQTGDMDIDSFKKALNGELLVNIDLTTYSAHNLRSEDGNATSIPVLNYHFFYDSSIGEECNEGNCLDTKYF